MTEPDLAPDEVRRRRLTYRATHRGTHETDLLVGGFVQARVARMTPAELDALDLLLDWPDVDLADWLTGRRPLPDADEIRDISARSASSVPPPLVEGGKEEAAGHITAEALILLRRMKDAASE